MEKKFMNLEGVRRKRIFLFLCFSFFFLFSFSIGAEEKREILPFSPKTPLLDTAELRSGMEGIMKTVVSGTSIEEIPVKIISVISRKEKPHRLILLKAFGPLADSLGGIASGMSGSPVYVEGKLAGAIGYGWEFSDHRFALATSVEDMIDIWSNEDLGNSEIFPGKPISIASCDVSCRSGDLAISEDIFLQEIQPKFQVFQGDGFSPRSKAALEKSFSFRIEEGLFAEADSSPASYKTSLVPGMAMGALLAWGDVSLGAIGTVSAVDVHDRFIAFAHPFLNRGIVSYPVSTAYIHGIIPSVATPFKLGSMGSLVGIMTRDTAQGVGGRFRTFAPSVSFEINLKMPRSKEVRTKKFHVVNDPYVVSELSGAALLGIVDNLWGRKGEGTALVTLTVDKTSFFPGWQWENMYFSDQDIARDCLKDTQDLIRIFTINPFLNIFPLGFSLEIEILEKPRILYVEDLQIAQDTVEPGASVDVQFYVRPYRGERLCKNVRLTLPENYSGTCEVVARGGGIAELEQEAVLDGWKSIASMDQFLKELDVMESNNEIIVELLLDKTPSEEDDDETHPFLSSVIASKIAKGEMRIFRTNYFVEGLLRKKIHVKKNQ